MARTPARPCAPANAAPSAAESLLARAHSPTSTARILTDKIKHKPLALVPSRNAARPSHVASSPAAADAREARRARRAAGHSGRRKPQPLSAADKRRLGVHAVPRAERQYALYAGLHAMWLGYMRDILDVGVDADGRRKRAYVTAADAGPKITGADFHGARLSVVRSRCTGRVGAEGIVVRDTKFTFVLITPGDRLVTVPKEGSIFCFTIPLDSGEAEASNSSNAVQEMSASEFQKELVFELHGEHFRNRAPDRASRKFKAHISRDL